MFCTCGCFNQTESPTAGEAMKGTGEGPGKGPATGDQGYCAPNSTPGQVVNSFCWQMSKCNLIFIN